jgi:outer membrane protein TolC
MAGTHQRKGPVPALGAILATAALCCGVAVAPAQPPAVLSPPVALTKDVPPADLPDAVPGRNATSLPINLPAALQLANVRPVDIAIARERIRLACAELERADVAWLPTIYLGLDYARHDGRIQDEQGHVFDSSRGSLMAGAGPSMVFDISDALYAPLAAQQVVRARQAELQATANDCLLTIAEAYFTVQEARGDMAAVDDVGMRTEEMLRRTEKLSPAAASPAEAARLRTEMAHLRQELLAARQRWQTASTDLASQLQMNPQALVVPQEPPHLKIALVDLRQSVDELIPLALTCRPELAAQQALVQATLARLKQERIRPLVPSVVVHGTSTSYPGTLAGGVFGGGSGSRIGDGGGRADFDVQVLWELQNLGLGNRARIQAREAEHHLSLLCQLRLQDQVAAEVVKAHGELETASECVRQTEVEVKHAVETANRCLADMPTVRPQEGTAALEALRRAYAEYYRAVADYNRGQFRLYRALGAPAQHLAHQGIDYPPAPKTRARLPDVSHVATVPARLSGQIVPAATTPEPPIAVED